MEEVAALLLGTLESRVGQGPVHRPSEPTSGSTSPFLFPASLFKPAAEVATVAHVKATFLLARKEKKKDRVEIDSQLLSLAMEEAESRGLTVIGWIHSHPKITILPSHVDLATQLNFQSFDQTFFGLIYGCFHENQNSSQRLQLLCFQSRVDAETGANEKVDIPLQIVPGEPPSASMLLQVPKTYIKEELLSQQELAQNVPVTKELVDRKLFTGTNTHPGDETLSSLSNSSPVELLSSALRLAKIKASLVDPILLTLQSGCSI
ncbi:BRCA1 BRCA2-containing complex, subunit 3 [Kappamyces sp. JEL0680]|nr:BRCA1 BRCA2-containing complex, subunit 3 [Kappamyces sp. JEL0680]